jgi:BirA family transcriptional regulator, biotin operon repressor / biotin---[acetyl-CoA-carboxylase] ligase
MRALTIELLRRLSHAHFTSGAALATEFGVSRSVVSAALGEAGEVGLEIFSLPRKGYRLAAPLELLDLAAVRTAMGRAARRVDLDIVPLIDSTNTAIATRLAGGAPSGIALAAEQQSAGRGRRGRSWVAPFGSALTFTLGWRFARSAGELGGLSLAAGVAIARAINRLEPAAPVALKWPNDIVAAGRKLGGILIEAQGDMLGPTAVAIGIGLNVSLTEAQAEAIDQPVTDVTRALGRPASRNDLLARVLVEMVGVLDTFQTHGFAAFADEWNALNALDGARVRLHPGDGTWFDADVLRVADNGALIVRCDGVERAVTGGEVSLRARR